MGLGRTSWRGCQTAVIVTRETVMVSNALPLLQINAMVGTKRGE